MPTFFVHDLRAPTPGVTIPRITRRAYKGLSADVVRRKIGGSSGTKGRRRSHHYSFSETTKRCLVLLGNYIVPPIVVQPRLKPLNRPRPWELGNKGYSVCDLVANEFLGSDCHY